MAYDTGSTSIVDKTEGKTHQNLANTLYKIIQNSNEGLTIGLEGRWGSGKSTVIDLLRKKINGEEENEAEGNKPNILYFYFDAWEHEGDPLRRVFLEEFIHQSEYNYLKSLHKVKDWLKKKSPLSFWGYFYTLSLFFIPEGIKLVLKKYPELVVNINREFHKEFWLGIALILAPLWIFTLSKIITAMKLIIFHLFEIMPFIPKTIGFFKKCFAKVSKKGFPKSYERDNKFYRKFNPPTIFPNQYTEQDHSSIEFARKFYDIILHLVKYQGVEKIVIVLDNLDRINSEDSLKMWSTLQTYLQYKNPEKRNSVDDPLRKIWTLVPYDEEGLKKLWDTNEVVATKVIVKNEQGVITDITKEYPEPDNSCSKSFFHKNFQLVLDVPDMVFDHWEDLAKDIFNEIFDDNDNIDAQEVISALKLSRLSITDSPTPRELTILANQVKVLKIQRKDISLEAIVLFSVFRYIQLLSKKDIEDKIVDGSLFANLNSRLQPNTQDELCGLLYGIDAHKGAQIVLEPKLHSAIRNQDHATFSSMLDTHKDSFWNVLQFLIINLDYSNPVKLINYTNTINKTIFEDNKENSNLKTIISIFYDNINSWTGMTLPNNAQVESYISLFTLFNSYNHDTSYLLYRFTLPIIKTSRNSNGLIEPSFDQNKIKSQLITLNKFISLSKRLPEITTSYFNETEWIAIISTSIERNLDLHQIYKPDKSFTDSNIQDMVNKYIKGKYTNLTHAINMIKYFSLTGRNQWASISCSVSEIFRNTNHPTSYKAELYTLIETLWNYSLNNRHYLTRILETESFWKYCAQMGTNYHRCALLVAQMGLPDKTPQVPGAIGKDYNFVVTLWRNGNQEFAQYVWDAVKQQKKLNEETQNKFHFIWSLTQYPDLKTVGSIIELALNEDDEKIKKEFFNQKNIYQLYLNSIQITQEEKHITSFIQYSDIISSFSKYIDNLHIEIESGKDLYHLKVDKAYEDGLDFIDTIANNKLFIRHKSKVKELETRLESVHDKYRERIEINRAKDLE